MVINHWSLNSKHRTSLHNQIYTEPHERKTSKVAAMNVDKDNICNSKLSTTLPYSPKETRARMRSVTRESNKYCDDNYNGPILNEDDDYIL